MAEHQRGVKSRSSILHCENGNNTPVYTCARMLAEESFGTIYILHNSLLGEVYTHYNHLSHCNTIVLKCTTTNSHPRIALTMNDITLIAALHNDVIR